MNFLLPLLFCLTPEVRMTTLRQLGRMVRALLVMTGRNRKAPGCAPCDLARY